MGILPSAFKAKGGPRSRAQIPEPRSRDDVVAAQYNAPGSAADYADSHEGSGPVARYFRSRMNLVAQTLASSPGGNLLDAGCGPGMIVRELLDSRPGDFRITALDRSPAMVEACALRAASASNVRALVGRVETMPFPDASFDVVLAMGVLEYTELTAALAEIARVTRPDGLVLVTMLNPMSPYRFVEWHVYWPLLRMLRALETLLNVPPGRRHGPAETGIRAYRERSLRGMMAAAGFRPVNAAYFDVTLLVPPIDRLVRRWARGWQKRPEHTISRGWRKWLGTAYMVVAHKAPSPTVLPMPHSAAPNTRSQFSSRDTTGEC
ncbi:MAG: class I SAM-dependent methyltransferase [Acetobacteraceae bacterium]|nr:class I SAM-dependent methyltransferase [Acetobacteraceae bacterium]